MMSVAGELRKCFLRKYVFASLFGIRCLTHRFVSKKTNPRRDPRVFLVHRSVSIHQILCRSQAVDTRFCGVL